MKVYASSLIVPGRPARPAGMDSATARLCMGYTVATAILHGQVGIQDFDPTHWPIRAGAGRPHRGAGRRQSRSQRHVPAARTASAGRCLALDMPEFPGSPALPLDEAAQDAKFRACCASNLPCRRTGPRR